MPSSESSIRLSSWVSSICQRVTRRSCTLKVYGHDRAQCPHIRLQPMPTEKDPTQELQAQVLDGIRKSQEAVIDGMRTWAKTIQQLVPGTPRPPWPAPTSCPLRPRLWTRCSTSPPSS